MLRRSVYLILFAGLMIGSGRAQTPGPVAPRETDMYCGGIATTQAVHPETHVISGAESDVRIVFKNGDRVFINKGANKGVKVGDLFQVTREESDQVRYPWFAGQDSLTQAMGTYYADVARLRVVNVQDKTSIAEVVFSCDLVQRGDMVENFVERPAPAFKAERKLDEFATPSGKAKAMVVFTRDFGSVLGAGKIVYVNLGATKGIKVGDYFRVFHYQGEKDETVYNTTGNAYQMFGLGSTPTPYAASDLPRDILGEGLVLRVSPSAATVLITNSQREMHIGDYVELE